MTGDVEWSVDDPGLAQVSAGTLTALSVGDSTLTARYAELSAQATLSVQAAAPGAPVDGVVGLNWTITGANGASGTLVLDNISFVTLHD